MPLSRCRWLRLYWLPSHFGAELFWTSPEGVFDTNDVRQPCYTIQHAARRLAAPHETGAPRLHKRVLPRTALLAKLREAVDYRLTLVQAGTGYGKSTALAARVAENVPLFWYSLHEADTDPQRFLSYFIAAFDLCLPSFTEAPVVLLQEISNAGSGAWVHFSSLASNGGTLAPYDFVDGS
jgi:hypothetical protein